MIEKKFDERRTIIIPGNELETVAFCARQFIAIGKKAIAAKGRFITALCGGNTPQAIFKLLSTPSLSNALDWTKVLFFWSDERAVSPDSAESNYHNAMEAGLKTLPILPKHVFRMRAEEEIEKNAQAYARLIEPLQFDLIMLGMGEDGHTASLFPHTQGLHETKHLVIANYIPQKQTWRMTMTYTAIHQAQNICIYVIGKNKADCVAQVLLGQYDPENFPIQKVGTSSHKAFWILDNEAASLLNLSVFKIILNQ